MFRTCQNRQNEAIFVVRFFLLLISPALLTGCATEWHRPGTTKTVIEEDLGHCEQRAAVLYPQKLVTVQTSAGYWSPATQQCWRSWRGYTCQQYPPVWNPPTYGQQDQNSPARHAWVRACMRGLGFSG